MVESAVIYEAFPESAAGVRGSRHLSGLAGFSQYVYCAVAHSDAANVITKPSDP